jgi:hypothetical protein
MALLPGRSTVKVTDISLLCFRGRRAMSKGATGVRVMFSKEAAIAFWKARSEMEAKERKSHAA